MKSQDILLMLKLISIHGSSHNRLNSEIIVFNNQWQDWDEDGLRWQDWDEEELSQNYLEGTFLESQFSVRALAHETGISKSQVSLSLNRCYAVGLAKKDRKTLLPKPNSQALLEFIFYGLRYVFPAKLGEVTRGIATSIAAPVLQGKLMSAGELAPVWPNPKGNTKGMAVEPLHKDVDKAIINDPNLYAMLALTDAIRLGHPRERNMAFDKLNVLIKELR
jgi:hypothetical protein